MIRDWDTGWDERYWDEMMEICIIIPGLRDSMTSVLGAMYLKRERFESDLTNHV